MEATQKSVEKDIMDKNKKTKLFVRILCAILAVVMTLSIILPVAYAAELDNGAPYYNGDGFEYIEQDGEWYLNLTSEKPVVRLTNVPESFTRDNMPVLIANVDTFEVHIVNLLEIYGYAAALDIAEGYYLVVTNNYAWADENNNKWALNNAQMMYFYYGDTTNFDMNKYDLQFYSEDEIIDLPLTPYTLDDMPIVKANGVFHFDETDSMYPLDEIHNVDEIIARVEHIDLAASLEEGHPVYMDGYTPNDPSYYAPNTSEVGGENPSTTPNLDNLATGSAPTQGTDNLGASDPNTPTDDVPVAQPELQETKPLPEVESQQPDDGTAEDSKKNPIEMVGDKLGIESERDDAKTAFVKLWQGSWFYLILIAVVGFIYYRMLQKKEEIDAERIEIDKYDDSCIE